jgi:hypothetical protein
MYTGLVALCAFLATHVKNCIGYYFFLALRWQPGAAWGRPDFANSSLLEFSF